MTSLHAAAESGDLRAVRAGGDRAVGEDEGLSLDASTSADPDEPTAALQFVWSCSTAAADA